MNKNSYIFSRFKAVKNKFMQALLYSSIGKAIPDKQYIQLMFAWKMGKFINLKSPKTFNEKLNWIKLYDHNPLYTKLVDKFAVKEWVKDRIGDEYVIKTLGIWDNPNSIEWDKLPNKFVLKTTHGGGGDGVIICRDKNTFDIDNAIKN